MNKGRKANVKIQSQYLRLAVISHCKNTLILFTLLGILTSCQYANRPSALPVVSSETTAKPTVQKDTRLILNHNAPEVAKVLNWPGLGFDSAHEEAKGSCLEQITLSPSVGQKRMELSFSMAESHEELVNSFDLGGRVGFNWGFLAGSGSLDFLNNKAADNYSLYLVMKATLNTQTLSVERPNLSDSAETILATEGYDDLAKHCGDQFVSSLTLGGSYYAVFRIVASSFTQKEEFKATIRIRILFATITKHIHRVMKDIHRESKEMSFVVFQTPNLIETLQSGDFSLVNDTASFVTEAQNYLEKLEQHCQVSQLGNTFTYPNECVSVITLQDYLTLTPHSLSFDEKTRQQDSLSIKLHLKGLGARLTTLEHDLLFVTQQPFFFDLMSDSARRILFAERYEEVKSLKKTLEADLDYCTESLTHVSEGRCEAWVSGSAGSNFANLVAQLEDFQRELPERQEPSQLPETCQQVAEFDALKLYQNNTLYYQARADQPFRVLCFPSFSDDDVFEEYINVAQDSDFTFLISSGLQADSDTLIDGLDVSDTRANIARFNHQGRVQVTQWQRYRIDPLSMRLVSNNLRFANSIGYAGDDAFDLNYRNGMPAGAIYGCASERPMRLFSYINLEGSDFVIDPLTKEAASFDLSYQDASSQSKLIPQERFFPSIDTTGQHFSSSIQLEPNECLSAVVTGLKLLPRSSIDVYD